MRQPPRFLVCTQDPSIASGLTMLLEPLGTVTLVGDPGTLNLADEEMFTLVVGDFGSQPMWTVLQRICAKWPDTPILDIALLRFQVPGSPPGCTNYTQLAGGVRPGNLQQIVQEIIRRRQHPG